MRVLAAVVVLTGCAKEGAEQATNEAPPEAAHANEGGYAPPPELATVAQASDGRLDLNGRATPLAQVRLASPGRAPMFSAADAAGRWRLAVPAPTQPMLLGLSMADHGRTVQAQGYIFLGPDGQAARLRAGGGSEALATGSDRLVLSTLDYDNQRAATLSGLAPTGETVGVRVDGAPRGEAAADAHGRFVLPLNQPLAAGPHTLEVAAGAADARISVVIDRPASLQGPPYRITPTGAGWRTDWLTPGGGEQTTLIFRAAAKGGA